MPDRHPSLHRRAGRAAPCRRSAASRGYTLIETMVAVALLAILMTMAMPSFRSFMQRRHLDGASAQLQADLHLLRSSSVALNQALRISVYSSGGGSCYLVHTGDASDCNCTFPSGGEPAGSCSSGVELLRSQAWSGNPMTVQANVASMRVDPRHGTFSPTGSIELQAGDGPVLRHVVNILGRVRLCTSSGLVSGVSTC
jgi:type IV fimbrial biogenesis protein FimT